MLIYREILIFDKKKFSITKTTIGHVICECFEATARKTEAFF